MHSTYQQIKELHPSIATSKEQIFGPTFVCLGTFRRCPGISERNDSQKMEIGKLLLRAEMKDFVFQGTKLGNGAEKLSVVSLKLQRSWFKVFENSSPLPAHLYFLLQDFASNIIPQQILLQP
jgi:hypothetical protein